MEKAGRGREGKGVSESGERSGGSRVVTAVDGEAGRKRGRGTELGAQGKGHRFLPLSFPSGNGEQVVDIKT